MKLLNVILFTSDMEGMKRFYTERVGLTTGHDDAPHWVDFKNLGAALALHPTGSGIERGIQLAFEVEDMEADVAALRARGARFECEIERTPHGQQIPLFDPDGNRLMLLQPVGWRPSSDGPRLSAAIVSTRNFAKSRAFYRDVLGLKISSDTPSAIEFDAGATALELQSQVEKPALEKPPGQRISFDFSMLDFTTWVEEARARGLHFTTVPTDEGFGLFADAADPDGNEVTFRELPEPPAIEEQLAEEFEEDAIPHLASMRKPVKDVKALSRVVLKPEYKPNKRSAKSAASELAPRQKRSAASVLGGGPAGSRLTPRTERDGKRVKAKPAIGRLRKAERVTLKRKKLAVASASKSKPVKHAIAARGPGRR